MSTPASHISRPLSARESQIVGWLEEERPQLLRAADLMETFRLPQKTASDVLRRMAAKGWLQRVAQGVYEPLLADSGGIALPNPWAALAGWKVPYYVSYGSAAYELGLTPDRPGVVQACVGFGTRTPGRFEDLPLVLIPQRHFTLRGTRTTQVHGQSVRMANLARVVIDSAIRPARVGGVIPFARILYRAADQVDWKEVVKLADDHPRGGAGVRRIAAVLTLLGKPVPRPVSNYAHRHIPANPMALDDVTIFGRGPVLSEWAVMVNVAPETLREELQH